MHGPRDWRWTLDFAENVFKGFSTDEIDNQYLMQPYCGFRFAGKIEIEEDCEL